MFRFHRLLLGLTLAGLGLPLAAGAQERTVVSKEISVGRTEASLRLEFSTGDPLKIALSDGSVLIDGEAAGTYTSGDALDAAWRALLGEAVALDDGALSKRLRDWSPPQGLSGDDLSAATDIDLRIEDALSVPAEVATPDVTASTDSETDAALVRALIGQGGRLATLQEALDGLGSNLKLHVDENVNVYAGEKVDRTLVVVQGNVRIAGEVDGDVVVVDGALTLEDGSKITGDVRLADATLHQADGSTVEGNVVNVERRTSASESESEIRSRLREELRKEIRQEVRSKAARDVSGSFLFNPLRHIMGAVAGVIENLVGIVILGLIGMGLVSFAPRNLEVVADTARHSPGRAALVGLAGSFLLIPVWVLGAIALAVSIVGIPVMLAWLPLFPLAAVAAGLLGYLAVARNVGEWLADSEYRYTDWIRKSNPVYTIVGGVVGLSLFFVAANVLQIVPFFGFFRGLLVFAGTLATMAAVLIGFGAVLLTRAGQRPEYAPVDFDEAWERSVDGDTDASPSGATGGSADDAEGEGGRNA